MTGCNNAALQFMFLDLVYFIYLRETIFVYVTFKLIYSFYLLFYTLINHQTLTVLHMMNEALTDYE